MPQEYIHPETRESVTIPDGAEIERTEDGEIKYWRNPPEGEQNSLDGYQYVVEPLGPARRVLAFITDEVDETAFGPRNQVVALARALSRDTDSPSFVPVTRLQFAGQEAQLAASRVVTADAQVEDALKDLEHFGLVEYVDHRYVLTDAGREELRH